MKKYFIGLVFVAGLNACNNSSSDVDLKDPSTVQHRPRLFGFNQAREWFSDCS